jgi:hypothetical protein
MKILPYRDSMSTSRVLLLSLVFVADILLLGYIFESNHVIFNTTPKTQVSASSHIKYTPVVPTIKSTPDLNAAEAALNQVNPSSDNISDMSQLSSQSSLN